MRKVLLLTGLVIVGVLGLDLLYTRFYVAPMAAQVALDERAYRWPNPDYHHGLRPNFSGYGNWGGRLYPIATNSLGFKDARPRQVARRSDKRRVVFVGDSFTEGVGLAWDQTFVGRFAAARPDLEVLNAGAVGSTPTIYYRKIKWLMDQGYAFDHVWVFIDLSDIPEEGFQSEPQTWPALARAAAEQRRAAARREGASPPEAAWRLDVFLRTHLFLTANAVEKARALIDALGNKYKILKKYGSPPPETITIGKVRWTLGHFDPGYFRVRNFEQARARVIAAMDSLHAMLSAKGITLSVAVYPWPGQIYFGDRNSVHVRMWRDWCRNKCRNFLDLFPVFFREAEAVSRDLKKDWKAWLEALFIHGDVHYNEKGNALIAAALLKVEKASGEKTASHRGVPAGRAGP